MWTLYWVYGLVDKVFEEHAHPAVRDVHRRVRGVQPGDVGAQLADLGDQGLGLSHGTSISALTPTGTMSGTVTTFRSDQFDVDSERKVVTLRKTPGARPSAMRPAHRAARRPRR